MEQEQTGEAPAPDDKPEPAGGLVLSAVEARVLASMIEKEATTPDYYPMTMNALVAACNQKSNRDPVMVLDEKAVADALDELRYRDGIAWQVSQSGSRVPKFRHDIQAKITLGPVELTLVCELMLRGPQTLAELRTHIKRLSQDRSLEEVEEALGDLMDRADGPFAAKLAREPGRRECRYALLLCGPPEAPLASVGEATEAGTAIPRLSPLQQQVVELESDVAALREELAELRAVFDQFRQQFE